MNPETWLRNWLGARRAPPDVVRNQMQQWLHRNTFHYAQFADLKSLVAAKEAQGLRISLCLPALNEERTIGKEVVLFRSELMQRYPLLDEIAVFDSGSTDRTREIAAEFGAEVFLSSDILPDQGDKKGKGENLWKAIYQLKGDVIVYIDTDISNIRPHFVYGLVAPLIHRPEIKYVKAFYDRPLTVSKGVRVSGGGRVTEILIRPLFSLFIPELTALIQPLSGEYAARREALERVAFPVGYGVETAHLIDIYHLWGLSAFGQTDLGQRVHRNQPVQALGKMSFGILQTFFHRMQRYGLVRGIEEFNHILLQFQSQENQYQQIESDIHEEERPPMLQLPAYQQKFGRKP